MNGFTNLHRVRHELDGQTSKREIHAPCEDCDDDDADDDDDDDDDGDAPHVVIPSPGKAQDFAIYIYIMLHAWYNSAHLSEFVRAKVGMYSSIMEHRGMYIYIYI